MKIQKIRLKNFRSISDEIEVSLNDDMTVFVGENNVGKSNIFIALKKLKMFLENKGNHYPEEGIGPKHPIFRESDWNLSNKEDFLEIEATLDLTRKEQRILIDALMDNHNIPNEKKESMCEEFGSKLHILFKTKWKINLSSPIIKMGIFFFNRGSFSENINVLTESRYQTIEFQDITRKYLESNQQFTYLVHDMLQEKVRTTPTFGVKDARVELQDSKFYEEVSKLFSKKFNIFEDIRQNPEGEEKVIEESFDGREMAAMLLNFKNNPNSELRSKYSEIQKTFTANFPQHSLEAIKRHKLPEIVIRHVSSEFEHSLVQSGTGILEFTIVIANLIGSKNRVFVFEEPELHLHPSAQRALSRFIENHSSSNQIIILTHSPIFVDHTSIVKNSIVRYKDGRTSITKVEAGAFSAAEISKIAKELNSERKEIFFARAVLLVEGPTELGALPIFAENLGKNFDTHNVYVCSVGGKKSFPLYQKILESFKIPYVILYDGDEGQSPESVITYEKKIVLEPDFEGVFNGERSLNLFSEAEKQVGNNKSRRGRYVAENLPKEDIPQEFIDVIDMVVRMSEENS